MWKGVERSVIAKVKDKYKSSASCVRVIEGRSGWLKQRNGLRKGNALSPLLFIIELDEMMVVVARIIEGENESDSVCRCPDGLGERKI